MINLTSLKNCTKITYFSQQQWKLDDINNNCQRHSFLYLIKLYFLLRHKLLFPKFPFYSFFLFYFSLTPHSLSNSLCRLLVRSFSLVFSLSFFTQKFLHKYKLEKNERREKVGVGGS